MRTLIEAMVQIFKIKTCNSEAMNYKINCSRSYLI
ncbi:uncharacterized protein METZ01_LOCUS317527 [marine metagenome]|uniref:Uncharacterized protein n=1 Tax=marine metagenome TaxID=408172 RepID=A0A382NU15_9ZZZZ